MPLVTASYDNGQTQVESVTRPQVLKRWLRESGLGQSGTATGGSTTTLVDTNRLQSTQFNDRYWVGGWVRLTSGTDISVWRTITTYAPSTGTITFNPAMGTGPSNGVTYELWRTPFDPSIYLDALDNLLTKEFWGPRLSWLTEVPDGDMEATGTSTYTNSNATLTKVSWSLSQEGVTGKQALSVATTSAGGYATLADAIGVDPGMSLNVGVNFTPNDRTATNTGTFVVYDVTNSAAIYTFTTSQKTTVRFSRTIQVPSTCRLLNVRMGSAQNSVTGIWDGLSLLDAGGSDLPLPWWIRTPSQVKGIYRWEPQQQGSGTDEYDPAFRGAERVDCDIEPWARGSGQVRATLREGALGSNHYWVFGTCNETAFASDTESKRVEENWLVAGLKARAAEILLRRSGHQDSGPLVTALNEAKSEWNDQREIASVKPESYRAARTRWVSL